MVERLLEKGYDIVVTNRSREPVEEATRKGAVAAYSFAELVKKLSKPRLVWIMVPHKVVDEVLGELLTLLEKGDVIIDGGNSNYKESMRRASELEKQGIGYLDVGVSGGPSGARNGASLMIGGDKELFVKFEDMFADLAVAGGYAYLGKSGAGHFVKMVHNGIEYGMMESIAEGFNILKNSEFNLDLQEVMKPYGKGSVIESRLISDLAKAFEKYGADLEAISGRASHSGEGQWTVETGKELGLEVGAIEHALQTRIKSQEKPSYLGKIISAMRGQFGGHPVEEKP